MRVLCLLLFLLTLGWQFSASAQSETSNLRLDTLPAAQPLTFAPGSLFSHTLSARNVATGELLRLSLTDSSAVAAAADSVLVAWTYRRVITQLREPIYLLDSIRLLNRSIPNANYEEVDALSINDLRRDLGAVDYRGTFGRGLRFGNSQNLVLDSRLDLQLNGDLGDGLTVSAVVSDQNIPLQPEGNTVQLQEFDKIFVTIAKDAHTLTAGDYSLRSNQGHFIRYDKNLQGLTYAYREQNEKQHARASLASARGQFQRIQLPVDDGNQGPYRLTGSRGEPFVIVLAGTERVYLDGRLLERGIDRDYVIDYNRGEVSFTPRLLINRFQRILVEYEFVDREYLRTLVTAEGDARIGNWMFYAQGLQQQDGLRRTGTPLSATAQQVVQEAPGTLAGTLVPSPSVLPEGSTNPLRYIPRLDTSGCSNDTIWMYAPTATGADVFIVSFTEVGAGQGNYRLARNSSTNGTSFEFVPPNPGCTPAGDYAPLKRVQTPRSLRLLALGGRLVTDSTWQASWELIGSQQDLNRYSPGAATSYAAFGALSRRWQIGLAALNTGAFVEGTAPEFTAIAPWRPAEFKRNWNLGNLATQATDAPGQELLTGVDVGLAFRKVRLEYELAHYSQEEQYSGFRQNWIIAHQSPTWLLTHSGDALRAERVGTETGQTNLRLDSRHSGPRWEQAFGASQLTTENYDAVTDATLSVDRSVREWYATTTRSAVDSLWTPSFAYRGRQDATLNADSRAGDGTNHQVEVGLASPADLPNAFELTATYRHTSALQQSTEPNNYYLGRAVHRFRTEKSAWLRLQTSAEAGSGQERRVALQYIKVQPGLGQYTWRDYNNDGVEDLGEFEVAVFSDSASYIRTTLLTDEFVATNTLNVTQSVNIDLSRVRSGSSSSGWWRRFSALNTASMRRRALQATGYERLLAVNVAETDTSIVGDDLAWRSALYFNRARNAFRAELEHRQLANRVISLQGLQQLRTNGLNLVLLQPLGPSWRLGADFDRERRRSRSQGLTERNFTLESFSAEPSLSFQPNSSIRLVLSATYREGNNVEAAESVTARNLGFEVDARLPEASSDTRKAFAGASLRAKVERVNQRFEGRQDSPAGFALLEGLRPGRSWIWNAVADQQLGKSLQLSLRYDGRQVAQGNIIHSGQAQLQAIF